MMLKRSLVLAVSLFTGAPFALAQQVTKPTVAGVTNFAKLETTVACGGAMKAADLKFFHIPFNTSSPDPAVPETFLRTLTTPGNEPAYIHCASGNRAAAMWMIKRIALDHWDTDRAGTEAAALGLTNPTLKQFAIDY